MFPKDVQWLSVVCCLKSNSGILPRNASSEPVGSGQNAEQIISISGSAEAGGEDLGLWGSGALGMLA